MKKFLKVVGIIILILVGLFVSDVVKRAKKIQKDQTEVKTIETDEEGFYKSEYSWQMKVPEGWGKTFNKANRMEMFTMVDKKVGDEGWAYVAVEPFARVEEVDEGGFLKKYKEVLLGSELFPNAKMVKEPTEETFGGAIGFDYLFDHDYQDGMRLRQFRKYLFPPEKGGGWLVYSQARVEDWDELEPVIMEAIESFH